MVSERVELWGRGDLTPFEKAVALSERDAERLAERVVAQLPELAERLGIEQQDRRFRSRFSNAELHLLHRVHYHHGVSLSALGELLWEAREFSGPPSARHSISAGLRHLGLPRRSRIAGARLSNVRHGIWEREGQTEYARRWQQKRVS